MVGAKAYAYDIAVENADGVTIYYNYINDATELEVTLKGRYTTGDIIKHYTGNVVIPDEVTYMNRTRKVTSIGESAFQNSTGLTSVTIPNSVKSIGSDAFSGCNYLKKVIVSDIAAWCRIEFASITSHPLSYAHHLYSDENTEIKDLIIPNGVTTIGKWAFRECTGLTSVTIPNSVTTIGNLAFDECTGLTSVTIPNSVTSICGGAFYDCSGLTSVTIPNSVTSIEDVTFFRCSGLTSVTIGSGVTSIGESAFSGCSGLTSVTIPNSVTSIGRSAFSGCSGLTSVTIPNSVTSIEYWAFENCRGLTSITIGSGVTSIGSQAFYGVDIPTVISLIENPIGIAGKTSEKKTFTLNTFNNATLYVPKGTIDKYKATEGWKDFAFIEEGTGGGETPPTPQTCDKPTIGYQEGKLMFTCATEGATCYYSITDSDIKAGSENEIQLTATYNISVYAAKTGCQNSETATATLCWIDVAPKTEGITNGVAQIPANAVLIQTVGGAINVQGVDDGTQIQVYSINGTQAGTAISQHGVATINTSLQSGSVAIVKIGDRGVKVVLK